MLALIGLVGDGLSLASTHSPHTHFARTLTHNTPTTRVYANTPHTHTLIHTPHTHLSLWAPDIIKSCLSTPEQQQLQLFLLGIHHCHLYTPSTIFTVLTLDSKVDGGYLLTSLYGTCFTLN